MHLRTKLGIIIVTRFAFRVLYSLLEAKEAKVFIICPSRSYSTLHQCAAKIRITGQNQVLSVVLENHKSDILECCTFTADELYTLQLLSPLENDPNLFGQEDAEIGEAKFDDLEIPFVNCYWQYILTLL